MALVDDFDVVLCVAGSRSYNNYLEFSWWVKSYVDFLKESNPDIKLCFVSGAARDGADAMIIRWCESNGYYCEKMPADWEGNGLSAGYIRNAQMREVITHLLAFWDGISNGTAEMIEKSAERGLVVATIIVTPDQAKDSSNKFFSRNKHHGKKRRRAPDSGGYRSNRSW